MLNTHSLQITPEILNLISRIDEFKGAWRALGTLAPDRLSSLRLANALLKRDSDVTVFLLGDAVSGAKAGQKTPEGFYSIGLMVQRAASKGSVLLCGSCLDARGLADTDLVPGTQRSTMDELAEATELADKVLVF